MWTQCLSMHCDPGSSPVLPFLSSFEPPFLGALVGKLNTNSSQVAPFFQLGPPKTF